MKKISILLFFVFLTIFNCIPEASATGASSLTLVNATSTSITVNAVFPISGKNGNRLGWKPIGSTEEYTYVAPDATLTNGTYTINGLSTGTAYEFVLTYFDYTQATFVDTVMTLGTTANQVSLTASDVTGIGFVLHAVFPFDNLTGNRIGYRENGTADWTYVQPDLKLRSRDYAISGLTEDKTYECKLCYKDLSAGIDRESDIIEVQTLPWSTPSLRVSNKTLNTLTVDVVYPKNNFSTSNVVVWRPAGQTHWTLIRDGSQGVDGSYTLRNLDENTSYEFQMLYTDQNSTEQSIIVTESTLSTAPEFLIIVSNPLYSQSSVKDAVATYKSDLSTIQGLNSVILKVNASEDASSDYICPTPQDLKNVISTYYKNGTGARGFVLIGSEPAIPVAYWAIYENWMDHIDEGETYHESYTANGTYWKAPTDLFYADMDGTWRKNADGCYVTVDKTGATMSSANCAELYSGRITAGALVDYDLREEADKVTGYLTKLHSYKVNTQNQPDELPDRAIAVTEDDWCGGNQVSVFQHYVQEVRDIYNRQITGRQKILDELQFGSQMMNLSFHAGTISMSDVDKIEPKTRYINLFACGQTNYNDKKNCLGSKLVFNNPWVLNLTGSTVSFGQFIDEDFVSKMNTASAGVAYRDLINYIITGDLGNGIIGTGGFGVTHLGDPTLRYKMNYHSTHIPQIVDHKNNKSFYSLIDAANKPITLEAAGRDEDQGDTVSVSFSELPNGAAYTSGKLNWTPTESQAGMNLFTAVAEDSTYLKYVTDFYGLVLKGLDKGFEETATPSEKVDWDFTSYMAPNVIPATYSMDFGNDAFLKPIAHSGNYTAKITCEDKSDAILSFPMQVDPNSTYKVTGYIKTQNVQAENSNRAGASITVAPNGAIVWDFINSEFYTGTTNSTDNGWMKVEYTFFTGSHTEISLQCRLGYSCNLAQGTAWFDDITVTKE